MKRRTFLTIPVLLLTSPPPSSARNHVIEIARSAINQGYNKKFKHLKLSEAEIKTQIQDDFKNNNIFEVQGWLLSDTEVQMCVNEYLKAR